MNKIKYLTCIGTAALSLSGCEYTKDLPILGRIVAKNVCDAVYVSDHDATTVTPLVAGFAPPLKQSWQVTFVNAAPDQPNASVEVRNRWFGFVPTQRAEVAAADLQHGCQVRIAGVVPGVDAPLVVTGGSYSFNEDLRKYDGMQAFIESTANIGTPAHTTALLVVHGDTIVAETYRDGLTRNAPIKGFSMSKSMANLLVGRLADKGLLDVSQPMPIDAWHADSRAQISWDDSLHMSSGLTWHEAAIGKDNDQTQMLYGSADPSLYALSKSLANPPGTQFNYSSGDFMNIATALVDEHAQWFDPGWDLDGRFSLEFTPDSHYPLLPEGVSLTLRGWAQLMTVYANEGRLGALQILSPEWVRYSLQPATTNGDYGAGIWLNHGKLLFPHLPNDAIAFIGAYDRYVVAIPSRDLVVVRMGYSEQPNDFDMQAFVEGVLQRLPAQ